MFYDFFPLSLTWDTIAAEISKTLLLIQIAAKSFQTSPEFSYLLLTQNCSWDFRNFKN